MKNTTLTQGSVSKSLLLFTLPIVAALLLQTLYSAVDLLIVGQFASVSDVTGVTVGSQSIQMLASLCSGLAVGCTVLIGRKYGENRPDEAEVIINSATVLFTALAAVVMLVLLLFNRQVVTLLKTPTDAVAETSIYLYICTLGVPLTFWYNLLSSILRGIGDSKTPLIAVFVACVTNIGLDILLVAGFGMGAAGAAVATIVAQGVSVAVSVAIMRRRGIKIGFKNTSRDYTKQIVKLGTPIALQSVFTSLSFVLIMIIINAYDDVVFSAAVGISEKICGIIMLIPIAFMQSIAAYVAQNMGAGDVSRCRQALKIGLTYSFIFGFFMAIFTFTNGQVFAKIFSPDADVIAAATIYLKAYALDVLLVSIIFCLSGYFNGLGKTTFIMLRGSIASLFLRTPFVYVLSIMYPKSLFHIGLGIPMATAIEIAVSVWYLKRVNKQLESQTTNL